MATPIAKQIITRMKAKDLSLSGLGKAAGVKLHTIQNILRGTSKKPNAETLQAIADALDCSIKDLLNKEGIFREEETPELSEELLNAPHEHPALLFETVQWVNEKIKQEKKEIPIKQVFVCIEEIYLHSLQKDPAKVDQIFAEWFFDLVTDSL